MRYQSQPRDNLTHPDVIECEESLCADPPGGLDGKKVPSLIVQERVRCEIFTSKNLCRVDNEHCREFHGHHNSSAATAGH